MSGGFTKLFSTITESSVWCEDDQTFRVWIAMLARADHEGVVNASAPGFANLCRMSLEEFQRAEAILLGPDQHSRTPDNEGRRIERIQGGWLVLNYVRYREQAQESGRAPYMRDYRKRKAIQEQAAAESEKAKGGGF